MQLTTSPKSDFRHSHHLGNMRIEPSMRLEEMCSQFFLFSSAPSRAQPAVSLVFFLRTQLAHNPPLSLLSRAHFWWGVRTEEEALTTSGEAAQTTFTSTTTVYHPHVCHPVERTLPTEKYVFRRANHQPKTMPVVRRVFLSVYVFVSFCLGLCALCCCLPYDTTHISGK